MLYFMLPVLAIFVLGVAFSGGSASRYRRWVQNPNKVVQISAGPYHYLTRTNRGIVAYTGQNLFHEGDVANWTSAIDISAGDRMSACVTSTGRVLLAGSLDGQVPLPFLNHGMVIDVSGWRDMVQVVAGRYVIYGLCSDGTVKVAGWSRWTHGQYPINAEWRDVIKIQAAGNYVYGLRKDGTILATVSPHASNRPQEWTDIVDIEQFGASVLGLKEEGTVEHSWGLAVVGGPGVDRHADLWDWTDIVDLAADSGIIAGLRSDGTVILEEAPDNVREQVESWTDIVAISAGENYLIGLTSDGTVLSTAPFEGGTP